MHDNCLHCNSSHESTILSTSTLLYIASLILIIGTSVQSIMVAHLFSGFCNRNQGTVNFAIFSSFYAFRGLTYGMSGPMGNDPNATQAAYKWLESWEI